MKKPLLEVIFMSEKRKSTLLLLKDGAKEIGYLLETLETTRTALHLFNEKEVVFVFIDYFVTLNNCIADLNNLLFSFF